MKEYSSKAFTDMYIGLVIILISWLILSEYDFFEMMIVFLEKHEDFELDELILLFLLMGIISTIYTYRRIREAKHLNHILEETISNLQETKEDLISVQKMATLGELVSSLTHEINTPIGISITSSSHLDFLIQELNKKFLKEEMTKEEFTHFISETKELSLILSLNLNNTKKLVQGFKNIAVDQAIEEKREFNLKAYINEILLSLKSKIKQKEITVNVNCPDDLQITTYPGAFSQVIINLINNSILHAFSDLRNEKISIIITELNDNILLEYSDSGKGLSEEVSAKIFDKYFTTKRGSGGTGLGLHIIEKIISEILNGEIKILEKSKEKGLGLLITIPKNSFEKVQGIEK